MQAIIYLHGFNSSPRSQKAQLIKRYIQAHHTDAVCDVPALPVEPWAAVDLVKTHVNRLMASGVMPALIGSSLGGFYAAYLSELLGIKAALINPAVNAHELLHDHIGEQVNFHTGERYSFTDRFLQQLQTIATTTITKPENFFVLLQTGDEVLDYRRAVALFSRSSLWVEAGGSHAFDDVEKAIPAMLNFLHYR